MADVQDVCNVLVGLIASTLYPTGTGNPSTVGVGVRVFPGWPLASQLDADMAAVPPICDVSVYPRPEEHNTTRYPRSWATSAYVAPTLTLTISGQTVAVGGTVGSPFSAQNLGVNANSQPYVYGAQASDTPTSIATALATLIAIGVPGTTSSGPVVTLPPGAVIESAVAGGSGVLIQEVKRQERLIQIGIWSPTPAYRDAIAQALDPILAATDFLSLPDGSSGRLIYKSSPVTDGLEKQQLYRRDLMYTVEYATTQATPATEVVALEADLEPSWSDGTQPAAEQPQFVTVNIPTTQGIQSEAESDLDTQFGDPIQTET